MDSGVPVRRDCGTVRPNGASAMMPELPFDDMDGSTGQNSAAPQFDPQRLIVEVDQCFKRFHFTIQTSRPDLSFAERLKVWHAGRAAAESSGQPFDDPLPVLSHIGSATFECCSGEERESGFVLKLSMKADSGRPFTMFIEEGDMVPEREGVQGPNLEASIAAQLAFWTDEMICHGTPEEPDGRAVGSGRWLKTWT